MRALALVISAGVLSSCALPAHSDRDYRQKAGYTARSVASSVATALLATEAAGHGKATAPYLSVLLEGSETEAGKEQSTFDQLQPPNADVDALRTELDAALSDAVGGLATLRIAVRRGEVSRLPELAAPLQQVLGDLRALGERYR